MFDFDDVPWRWFDYLGAVVLTAAVVIPWVVGAGNLVMWLVMGVAR